MICTLTLSQYKIESKWIYCGDGDDGGGSGGCGDDDDDDHDVLPVF